MIGLTEVVSDVTPAPINTLPYSEKVGIGFPGLLTIYEGGTFPSIYRALCFKGLAKAVPGGPVAPSSFRLPRESGKSLN